MQPDHQPAAGHTSPVSAVRHHLAVVIACLALGALGGWAYGESSPPTYTSSARVLVNPSVGNPFAPTPSSVRQDELTSLETEAQVARSAEVLRAVARQGTDLTTDQLERRVQVTVPPNTQVLEISYSSSDPQVARQVADAVANAYLANRARRFEEVNAARIKRVENQTLSVVSNLRAATAAAQVGSPAERSFQAELADALRNELVSLRAQRSSLENSESPAGAVISPASTPATAAPLTELVMPVGGALLGLALGCLLAVLLERLRGVVRSRSEVEVAGLPVAAAVPPPTRRARLLRRSDSDAVDTTIRRLRATILDLDPRPNVIAVAPAGSGKSQAGVSEAVAESFAKAGHRVVLVRTDGHRATGGLGVAEPGLAQALLHERLNVLDLLQPSVEPLLCLLPDGGFTAQSRELLVADRLRAVLAPLVEAGHLVIVQSPGIDSAEGEAIVGASDLGLIVVSLGRTRPHEVEQATQARTRGAALAALVVGPRGAAHRSAASSALRPEADDDIDSEPTKEETATRHALRRGTR
jgi:succinoglycan biosynthesis transport protein ExoP